MKLTYRAQLLISCAVIVLTSIVSSMLKHGIYRNLGFVVCGLLWLIHPVLPNGAEVSHRTLLWVRLAGIVLILIGIFTRTYF